MNKEYPWQKFKSNGKWHRVEKEWRSSSRYDCKCGKVFISLGGEISSEMPDENVCPGCR